MCDADRLPPDLRRLLEELDATEARAAALAQGVSDAQLNWQPSNGRAWSIGQNLSHLARTNEIYAEAMSSALDRLGSNAPVRRGTLRLGFADRLLLRIVEPPVRLKFRAPAKAIPAEHRSGDEVLREFRSAHERIRTVVSRATGVECGLVSFPHPFFRLLSVKLSSCLAVIPAHNRRHLWQAHRVTESAGYPGAPAGLDHWDIVHS